MVRRVLIALCLVASGLPGFQAALAEDAPTGTLLMPKSLNVTIHGTHDGQPVGLTARFLDWPSSRQKHENGRYRFDTPSMQWWVDASDVLTLAEAEQFYSNQISGLTPPRNLADLFSLRANCRCRLRNFDKAAEDYTELMILYPRDPTFRLARGEAYGEGGHYDKAIADCNVVRISAEDSSGSLPGIGQGSCDECEPVVDFSVESRRNDYWLARAKALHELKKFEQAIEACDNVLRAAPNSAEAHCVRGRARAFLGEIVAAIDDYRTVLNLNPCCSFALAHLVVLYICQNQSGMAELTADRLLDVGPESDAFLARALVLVAKKDFTAAAPMLERAVAADPRQPSLQALWMIACIASGDSQRLDGVTASDPQDASMVDVIRGIARLAQQRWEDAIKDFGEAAVAQPAGAWLFRAFRAVVYIKQHNYAAAIADLTASLDASPGEAGFRELRGNCFQALGRNKEALTDFEAAIHADPDSADGYRCRADFNSHLGRYLEALSDCDRAMACEPNSFDDYRRRAIVRFRLRQCDQAIVDCDTAIALAQADTDTDIPVKILISPTAVKFDFSFNTEVDWGRTKQIRQLNSVYALRSLCHFAKGDVNAGWADVSNGLNVPRAIKK